LAYSALTVPQLHPLHHAKSIFAGMVMFTTDDVLKLIRLSKVSLMCLGVLLSSDTLFQPTLKFEDLKEHYDSYLAASEISVYNPVSICSALETNTISNYWISTGLFESPLSRQVAHYAIGEHPLIQRHIGSLSNEANESLTILLA
jgi:hypothetical protein